MQNLNFDDLEWRHDMMLALNPMSEKNQRRRWHERFSWKRANPNYKTVWTVMAWFVHHPDGIDPLHRSAEWIKFLENNKEENPDTIWTSFRNRYLKKIEGS
jgi:hypothetical protein